uniref:Putative secreted protein n=1 Tax=Anopheles marajoara TaxID=58244 RepID=A0A2M4CDD8_9DIPT
MSSAAAAAAATVVATTTANRTRNPGGWPRGGWLEATDGRTGRLCLCVCVLGLLRTNRRVHTHTGMIFFNIRFT